MAQAWKRASRPKQEARRAARRAELAAQEGERQMIEERQRQYNPDAAAVRALQGLSDAAQLEVLRKMGDTIVPR